MTFLRSIAIFLFALSAIGTAFAQTQEGRILGTVTDQSGGFFKSAPMSIINADTGGGRKLETNKEGDYVAPNIPRAPHTLRRERTGFQQLDRRRIPLAVGK